MKIRAIANASAGAPFAFALLGATFMACVEPPPKIAAIPASGLAVRLFVFGASAQEARNAFGAAKQNNKNFTIVREGGDGEVLVGLENDSPRCVAPTALCSFKVAVRVRDNHGKVVHASTTTASANAERCADLCDRALNAVVVKVVEAAAAALKSGGGESADASAPTSDPVEAGVAELADAGAEGGSSTGATTASSTAKAPSKKAGGKPTASKPEPPAKPEPAICVVGHGPTLPAEEAEKRAAQVEALKRLDILDHDEYDCLRKAYLERL